jgi:hypothetical protein
VKYPVLLQTVGWTLLFVVHLGLNHAGMPADYKGDALYEAASLSALGFLVSSGLWSIYRRLQAPDAGPKAYAVTLIGSLAGTIVWYALIHLLDWAVSYEEFDSPFDMSFGELAGSMMMYLFTMLAWHAAILAQRAIVRAANAQRLVQEARLQALRYQLNPHFLFNALNSVIAMIDEDPRRAQTMLTMLSSLLRDTLREDGAKVSTVGQELEVVSRYVEIERVRFEDKLRVDVDVPEPARDCPLPPLLLHALVENAIKHGMRTSEMPLEVCLHATLEGDSLRIEVRNTGRLERNGGGLGLRNVAERLDAMYPGRNRLAVAQDGGVVRATVEIDSPHRDRRER